jgi:translation initiation factor eIF-2B subunit beta
LDWQVIDYRSLVYLIYRKYLQHAKVFIQKFVFVFLGTLAICLAAKRHSVPVLICAAFYKLTPMFVPNLDEVNSHGSPTDILPFSDALKYPSMFISNPLFDLIPAQLVSLYVTHTSAISPAHIYRLIADYYHPDDFYNVD